MTCLGYNAKLSYDRVAANWLRGPCQKSNVVATGRFWSPLVASGRWLQGSPAQILLTGVVVHKLHETAAIASYQGGSTIHNKVERNNCISEFGNDKGTKLARMEFVDAGSGTNRVDFRWYCKLPFPPPSDFHTRSRFLFL